MEMSVAAVVDIGVFHTENDDRILVGSQVLDQNSFQEVARFPYVAAVCDGVGGYAGGGYAAQWILSALGQENADELSRDGVLEKTIADANERLINAKREMAGYADMCTTIAGVLFTEEGQLVFHAGDSRVYRYDGQYLSRMTVDHSLVRELVDNGVISEQEAAVSPDRNKIVRCLGTENTPPPEFYRVKGALRAGEIFMICSDGLWEGVSDTTIKETLAKGTSLLESCRELVELAKAGGSDDNISVCLCGMPGGRITEEEEPLFLD